ncbi:MAG TPA: hypothetical protein PLM07_10890 [Candidatus Rifleibacterium sp.]|nr:hypothetical protein [Candidatus Rifleibacterium sp.]HPT46398.1 hypothetical protein [Candidatus Rifleibacterium sp.]
MKKIRNFSTMAILLVFVSLSCAWGDAQTFTRLFSYDPHPLSAEFPQPFMHNGESLKHQVVFQETWKTVKDKDVLQTIKFTLQAVKGAEVVGEASTEVFTLKKISKGQKIGEARLGETLMTATIDEFEKSGAGITDLTVTFKLEQSGTADNKPVQAAKPDAAASEAVKISPPVIPDTAPVNAPVVKSAAGLYFCEALVAKAAALPAANAAARLSLLKKALAAAPAAATSAEAAAFHARVSSQISDLEKQNPAAVTSGEPVKPALTNEAGTPAVIVPVTPPAITDQKANVSGSAVSTVDPAARELYKSAKDFFAQDKGPEGREALRKSLEIAPDYQDALMLLGDNAYGNRKYARAKEAYEKLLNLNEKNSEALLKYFKAGYYLGEGSDTILRLAEIKNKYPADNGIKMSVAEAYFQLGDLVNAEAVCNEILSAAPTNSRAKDLMQKITTRIK